MEKDILLDASNKNKVEKTIESHPILGSHNTFTYLKPKNIWHYFCIPFARCQNKTLLQQLETGIRLFDIRIRFDNSGNIKLCHGLFEVKHNFKTYQEFIDAIFDAIKYYQVTNEINQQYVFRLILETSKENVIQELYFKKFCQTFHNYIINYNQENNSCHIINGCNRKYDWCCLYNGDEYDTKYLLTSISEFQHISSYPMYPETIKVRWYEKICPWLYAKRTNIKFKQNYNNGLYKNYDVVSYDFV